jgi:multiple sugar transport system ATP-binding protein
MLELRQVTKYYGRNLALKDLTITCQEREFLVIFGPAGAGKSTTLRLIAGISPMNSGEIWLDGQNLNGIPPENRNMAMAFENYALYSHLSVYDNLAFPLQARKIKRQEINRCVRQMAELLQITSLLERRPGFMSGGQRQRVALGRALIRDADIYLLDEPISHLDAKLRHHMRGELKAMCAEWDATVVYVTHDYKEAMALSDRIAVLNKGHLMQIGTPDEVYNYPANQFVASFLGDPPMSFLKSRVQHEDGQDYLQMGETKFAIGKDMLAAIEAKSPDGNVQVGARATDLSISPSKDDLCTIPVEVYVVETFGYRNIITGRCPGTDLVQSVAPPEIKFAVKDTAWLHLDAENVHLFSPSGEEISHPKSNNARKEVQDGIHSA